MVLGSHYIVIRGVGGKGIDRVQAVQSIGDG